MVTKGLVIVGGFRMVTPTFRLRHQHKNKEDRPLAGAALSFVISNYPLFSLNFTDEVVQNS